MTTFEAMIRALIGKHKTKRATAIFLGVGESTLRRWKRRPPAQGTTGFIRVQDAYHDLIQEKKAKAKCQE